MADEEGEIRRMAEIADAINAILEADPNSETTSAPEPTQDADLEDAPEATQTERAPDDVVAADDLDAAIAAEFSRDTSHDILPPADEALDPFGPAPDLDLADGIIDACEMADLSMRMQDTLAEIRAQSSQSWAGADDLLAEMEAARAAMVADIRGQIQSISDATQQRRDTIMAELTELENQSMMARDEMEIMLVKFEASLAELQTRYFQSAETEKQRLNRYREFLQFLLDERGM